MNAETSKPAPGNECWDVLASMGPRSHERGNFGFRSTLLVSFIASMGPRSHERGNLYFMHGSDLAGAGFNGAAFS